MNDYTANFDKTITDTFVKAQRLVLSSLLRDIKEHDYTVNSVISAINTELDSLDKLEKKVNE